MARFLLSRDVFGDHVARTVPKGKTVSTQRNLSGTAMNLVRHCWEDVGQLTHAVGFNESATQGVRHE
ncbi:hypothetical protein IE4872_PC00245 (plasmid) [Rhizobium gallicum]|uniref:Uncharacterized protein n=1 Tax=Rhizobium gallicum TaxID=56730 RepID=A0A1L5NQX7_9HYPH|nr:hypothetical protein IE4872_PC00245 [Rhizobium gallicum]